MTWLGLFNYWIVVILMMAGFYIVIAQGNLIKKIVGLNIFQTAVFIFYISLAKLDGGTAPVHIEGITAYTNPLPHVLILTAIVVGVALTAMGLALAVRVYETYGTIEEDELQALDAEDAQRDDSGSDSDSGTAR